MIKLLNSSALVLVLASTAPAHAATGIEADLDAACGPMPSAFQCGSADAACAMDTMARALAIHNCRMRALQMRILVPAPTTAAATSASALR